MILWFFYRKLPVPNLPIFLARNIGPEPCYDNQEFVSECNLAREKSLMSYFHQLQVTG